MMSQHMSAYQQYHINSIANAYIQPRTVHRQVDISCMNLYIYMYTNMFTHNIILYVGSREFPGMNLGGMDAYIPPT